MGRPITDRRPTTRMGAGEAIEARLKRSEAMTTTYRCNQCERTFSTIADRAEHIRVAAYHRQPAWVRRAAERRLPAKVYA